MVICLRNLLSFIPVVLTMSHHSYRIYTQFAIMIKKITQTLEQSHFNSSCLHATFFFILMLPYVK